MNNDLIEYAMMAQNEVIANIEQEFGVEGDSIIAKIEKNNGIDPYYWGQAETVYQFVQLIPGVKIYPLFDKVINVLSEYELIL